MALLLAIATGQTAPRDFGWEALETATPATLSAIMEAQGGDWREKRTTRIPGVAQWQGLNVEIASRARGMGYAGMCMADVASTFFRAERGAPGVADRLIAGERSRERRYLLTSARPTLARGAELTADCDGVGPILSDARAKDIRAFTSGIPSTSEQAAFAVGVVLKAQRRLPRIRCRSDDNALCRGAGPALGNVDARGIYRIDLVACPSRPALWCVEAVLQRPAGDGLVRIAVATANRVSAQIDPLRPIVRSAKVTTELWPIA